MESPALYKHDNKENIIPSEEGISGNQLITNAATAAASSSTNKARKGRVIRARLIREPLKDITHLFNSQNPPIQSDLASSSSMPPRSSRSPVFGTARKRKAVDGLNPIDRTTNLFKSMRNNLR